MKNTKKNRDRLLKKLERMNSDLALLGDFLEEHLEYNRDLHREKIQLHQQLITGYEEIIRFM